MTLFMFRERCRWGRAWQLVALAVVALTVVGVAGAQPADYTIEANGDLSWGGDKTDGSPIKDYRVPRQQTGPGHLDFYWTIGVKQVPHPDKPPGAGSFLVTYEPHPDFKRVLENNTSDRGRQLQIYRPGDANLAQKITGWAAQTTDGEGFDSKVMVGNVRRGSPWEFAPYSELAGLPWKIPVLGQAAGATGPTIYAAVNLALYLASNPFGPQHGLYGLDDLLSGIGSISNGELYEADGSKIEGIYFATSDWALDPDPDSTSGFYPLGGRITLLNSAAYQQQYGAIGIKTIFEVEEPSPLALAFVAAGGLVLGWRRRAHKGDGRVVGWPANAA